MASGLRFKKKTLERAQSSDVHSHQSRCIPGRGQAQYQCKQQYRWLLAENQLSKSAEIHPPLPPPKANTGRTKECATSTGKQC
eukprot:scaffold115533_cov12-Tisochrysis_lutea.AAC.1